MRYTPEPHHKKAIRSVIQQACIGLLLDRGLGKTAIMLAAFQLLRAATSVRRMLVVTGLRPAYEVWPAEREKWDDFHGLKMNVLHGPDKEKLYRQRAHIDVINPEGLPWLTDKVMTGDGLPWDLLCVDESTQFKHTDTVRFKLLKPLLPFFKRRVILTGNPAPNGLLDLFGQVYILDLGHALGNYVTYYRLNYFNKIDEHRYSIKSDGEERIYKKLRPYVLRMAAEDYLKLPPLVGAATSSKAPLVTEVTLPKAVRREYDHMENELIALIQNGKVNAANAAVASGKCRQIANGGIIDNLKKAHFLHDAKTDALEEMIDEFDGVPAFVAYEFHHDLARLQKRFPDAPFIGGGVPPKRFKEILQEWNRGNLRELFAQPSTVARGLNMQGTRANVVWLGPTWDQEIYDQFNSRVWRNGQKERVFVNHICAKDTIDFTILAALQSKHATSAGFLNAMKERHFRR